MDTPTCTRNPCAPCALLLVVLASLALPGNAAAQHPGQALVGERVRVTAQGLYLKGEVGRVVDAGPAGLRVDFGKIGVRPVGWEQMDLLEVSAETRTYGTRGFFIGVAGGAVLGAALGFMSGDDAAADCSGSASFGGYFGCQVVGSIATSSAGEKAAMGAIGLGLAGGLVGAIIGKNIRGERWVARSLAGAGPSLRPTFVEGRPGLSLRLPVGR